MENTAHRAIALVGAGAVLPDAPNVSAFWENVKTSRYSITDVDPKRWDPFLYYDPDPSAPDKTYSKIGGWVREFVWDPMKWRLAIPPCVVDAMDGAQKWAIACTRDALLDYGYPERPLDLDRTAVILGNAMAGEKHYLTSLRVYFPEYARELAESASFAALPEPVRRDITRELHDRIAQDLPPITEDSMPGELSNCIAGRLANVFNFHGPNFVCDAACASAMAAIGAAMEGLIQHDFDAAITGGVDRNMGAPTFVKFCKIGALSGTGTRPYAKGADGFVMGEGTAIFLLKRLADAERDGDKIYAVLRGMGASSDGKGKGLTAPNPVGQKLAVERAWQNAGLSPASATLFEGHGTSTRVGDVVEVQSLLGVLSSAHLPPASVALGSVKSNIGHLKGAAGAAGLLKAALALRDKMLPPSANFEHPNPDIDFAHSSLYVNTELKDWPEPADGVRRAGLSAFGFGGTNFHAVLEEYIPHRLNGNGKHAVSVGELPPTVIHDGGISAKDLPISHSSSYSSPSTRVPLRGALVIGAATPNVLTERLRAIKKEAEAGRAPAPTAPKEADLHAPQRLTIDYADATDLAEKAGNALKALAADQPPIWKALRAQGIFRGYGPAPKVAFLYPGQGSQYVNMLQSLREREPIVAETFAEADRVMTPLLGKSLSDFIFVNGAEASAVAQAEEALKQTAITQPAVLATDLALTRLLAAYGVKPDFAMGHSLGEYGALVAVGALPFADALEAVSARGRGMTDVAMADNGRMAAVFAPLQEIERILKSVEGYLVIANINSNHQAVIGGASSAVERAMEAFQKAGYEVAALPVSHAFHTSIVAPASEPLRRVLARLHLESPHLPIVANTNGDFYPTGPNVVPQMLDILAQQVASPVQFVKGLHTLYDAGARMFVEVGPKKALQGFAEDVLAGGGDVISLFTNHPKVGDIPAFNQALCGLYASGLGRGLSEAISEVSVPISVAGNQASKPAAIVQTDTSRLPNPASYGQDRYTQLGHLAAEFLDRAAQLDGRGVAPRTPSDPVVITGAALGLPGTDHVFDDANIARLLHGEQFIDAVPNRFRRAMVERHITRLVKRANGDPTFETIENVGDAIKLAGRAAGFDLEKEFGVPAERIAAFDRTTSLALAAGIDALRDAGIPLTMRYKTTSKGSRLPERWVLPESLRDDTGVIFASAFPGCDALAQIISGYYEDHGRREQLKQLEDLRAHLTQNGHGEIAQEIERRITEMKAAVERDPFVFDRRFLFRVLPMGHSQFAEYIGARGPNTQINAACASTTQAVGLAEDWIRLGRCRRVVVVSADDVTNDNLLPWFGSAFLASGVAATDESVEDAALPFDRRRHGMIIGMGAAALVVESAEAAQERGIQPICEVLGTVTANSAFHASRLDVEHIGQVMEELLRQVEKNRGIQRREIAPRTVFVSHETYTPARGGSASAEIFALRRVFGDVADQVVIANTKGYTGHAMAAGIEDVLAVKALETGRIPPVANFKEVDPELGPLNLSKGGSYPVEYALRLAAGFGSQISMSLLRWIRSSDGLRAEPNALGFHKRIVDETTWSKWLERSTGIANPELEVIHRTLRVRDQAATTTLAAPKATEVIAQPSPPPVVEATAKSAPPLAAVESLPSATIVATQKDSVRERVLQLVSEKTGYPADMLDIDLDLEADLGVDTVKQAEVFASIREEYAIPRRDDLRLREFPTLAHVIRFVYDNRPDLRSVPTAEETPKIANTPPAPASPSACSGSDAVQDRILALVVEKTGYPIEMLDVDLDLEADLGVDTVKQAEMFAAIRETYSIPREETLRLRDFPTLKHVIQFVYDKRPDLAAPILQPSAQASAPSPATTLAPEEPDKRSDAIADRVLELVAEKTGYPKDMLDLDLDLEADLGIDTVKQAELFASIRESYKIPREETLRLRDFPTLKHVIQFVYDKRPDLAAPILQAPVQSAMPSLVPNDLPEKSSDAIADRVLDLVAEKTGYPKDMLDLELDLEADLGIDTVKQAEMFASIRAMYNIPRDENLKLRDFPTLAHVIEFARQRSSMENAPAAKSLPVIIQTPPEPEVHRVLAGFDETNRVPRRVPVPVLRPPLALCKTTGVSLGSGSRVIVAHDEGGVAAELIAQLSACGVQVLSLRQVADATTLLATLKHWSENGPIHGVYWLPALDNEGPLAGMALEPWRDSVDIRVKRLYLTMRALYEQLASPESFLISATRLGGQHGYDATGAVAPLGGAVVGFTKSFKRERMKVTVKAVDFEEKALPVEVAQSLLAETLHDPGAVEIGYKQGLRWTVALQEQPAIDGNRGLTLNKDTVFLVTGAAGSIVSAITSDLAAASGGTFYLLDVVPEPDPQSEDLKRFVTDKDGLKRDLAARLTTGTKRATPAMVEKELANLERAQAAQAAINAVHAAGGVAHYRSINLTDAEAAERVLAEIRQKYGRVDVLLHAAGVERSHFLPDKDPKEFDLVFDVKANGFFNLLRAIGDMPLGAAVVFSSIAGRFGNGGQADYSAANDLLCKIISSFRSQRPQTRGIAVDWTAWGKIGMATRGSIPKMMELAGIDMIDPAAGVPLVRRELTSGGTRGEIVIAQRLGVLLDEFDSTGGLDIQALESSREQLPAPGPMIGKITGMGIYNGLTMETTLDPASQPFLSDHRIDGTPVLPGVMGIEAFAEAALCVHPGWYVDGIQEVEFLAPFKFYKDEPRTLYVEAVFRPEGGGLIADCRLVGRRTLATQSEVQRTTHFTARVRLRQQPREIAPGPAPRLSPETIVDSAQIYRVYFHGPAYQVLERAWWDGTHLIGEMAMGLPVNHQPSGLPTEMAPRLIELCFQTAGLWEMGAKNRLGLPTHVGHVNAHPATQLESGHLYAMVTPHPEQETFDAEVVDASGNRYLHIDGYRTAALPSPIDAESLASLQKLLIPQGVTLQEV